MGRRRRRRRRNSSHERMIMVQALKVKQENIEFLNEEGKWIKESYRCEEFHMVDLKHNKIYYDRLPSLPRAQYTECGHMVACGGSIFVFGSAGGNSTPLNKYAKTKKCQLHFFMGSSKIKFPDYDDDDQHKTTKVGQAGALWGPAGPHVDAYSINFTCLNGDVYSFSLFCSDTSPPEVLRFNKKVEEPDQPQDEPPEEEEEHGRLWKILPMPTDLDSCGTTLPVMADPKNNRILVFLMMDLLSCPSLYAFYPPKDDDHDDTSSGGTWECLHPKFTDISDVLSNCLLDGVIYLHEPEMSNLLLAYDVASGEELEVKWSTRVITEDLSVDDCYYKHFIALLCLDDTNKILCLATQTRKRTHDSGPRGTPTIFFFTFKAKRCRSTITLTPLYTRSYALPSAARVHNFLLL